MKKLEHVLIVDDDREIRELVAIYLQRNGMRVSHASSGRDMRVALDRDPPDLIVLDVRLPDADGLSLCRELRAGEFHAIPIVMLSARHDEADRIVGLELGADDYIAKPFSPRELVARVRTILRRSARNGSGASQGTAAPNHVGGQQNQANGAPAASQTPASPFALDTERMQIRYYGRLLELSRYEYGLLRLLVQRPGRVFTRDELLELVWDDASDSFDRTVDAHIKTLRAKLKAIAPDVEPIRTLRGTGYALNEELPSRA